MLTPEQIADLRRQVEASELRNSPLVIALLDLAERAEAAEARAKINHDNAVFLADQNIKNAERAGPGWQTMDSAPKDGTKFDVWYAEHSAMIPTPAHRLTDVYWSDVQEAFCTDGEYGPEEPLPLMAYPRPTHWRPLPLSPNSGEG